MKRKLRILLAAAVLLAVFRCGAALAEEYSGSCGERVYWELDTSSGTLTISGTGDMTEFIGNSGVPWYEYRDSITSVVIENGVTSIGRYAFYQHTNLTSIRIPAGVAKIGYRAFEWCSGLTEALILNPDAVIGDSDYDVFYGCASVFTIRGWTGSTAQIYAAAAGHAFESMSSGSCGEDLTYTYDHVTEVLTISGTGRMTEFSSYASAPWYKIRELVRKLVIEDGVTSIGRNAFYGLTNLSDAFFTIPGSVAEIGYRAFRNCEKLNSVTIQNSGCVIGDSDYDVFDGCSHYLKMYGWAGSTAEAYASAAGISFVPLGSTSGKIGDDVYYTVDTVSGAVSITGTGPMWDYGQNMYSPLNGHKGVGNAVIGSGVTSIGDGLFGMSSLTGITIPDSVTRIGEAAFYDCERLNTITVPNSVTEMGNYVFGHCYSLKSVTLSNKLTAVLPNSFYNCKSLTRITIPGSVSEIGENAFYDCSSLTSVTIRNGVTKIDTDAFYGCSSLAGITIPASVSEIDSGAFLECASLNKITVEPGSSHFCSDGGVLFDRTKTVIYCYPPAKAGNEYVIPAGVTEIKPMAFFKCTGLTGITIPDSVTSIGFRAFTNCTGLTEVVIPDSVTVIGSGAFSECSGLRNVTLSNGLSEIAYNTFYYCSGLTSIAIPDSVTAIGTFAFGGCSGLTGIVISGNVTKIDHNAFSGCENLTVVSLPASVTKIGIDCFCGCVNLISAAVHNPECVIMSDAFDECSSSLIIYGYADSTAEEYATSAGIPFVAITAKMSTPDFRLPAHLTAIEAEAFSGIKASVVYIPDTVTSLGSKAFAYCQNLTQIRIPASVTEIPPDVFYGLESLSSITVFGMPGSAAEAYANEKKMKFEVE